MSVESVRRQITEQGWPLEVIEFNASSATVELAAQALGVEPGRIAKTMAFQLKETPILILAKGDARIDNAKFKERFKTKARMLPPDEVPEATGHPVGGVCPFGLSAPLPVYLDETLRQFDVVYPAGGSTNSAVRISVAQLAEFTRGEWVDVCREPAAAQGQPLVG